MGIGRLLNSQKDEIVSLPDFREQYIEDITQLLEDEDFIRRNTVTERAFTRKRKLPFIYLVIVITQGVTRSIQRELNSFYQKIKNTDFSIQEVTKSAFTHARKKLKWEAFKELNQQGIKSFYRDAPYIKWKGYRLLGIDGSTLVLPNHPDIIEEFGTVRYGSETTYTERSMARISMLYDLLNFTTLDAKITKYGDCEIEMALDHVPHITPGSDIVILDRGYPSVPFMYELTMQGLHFIVRLKNSWLQVRDFLKKGETDKIVTFKLPDTSWKLLRKYKTENNTIQCRLIAVELPDGDIEVLCTSLLTNEQMPYEDFRQLYHRRWAIEESYKFYKCRLQLDIFSGKTPQAIRQDFYAKVFMMTTMAVFAFPIEEKLKQEQAILTKKHNYKINRTNAIALIKEMFPSIFIKKFCQSAIKAFDKILSKTVEIIRPDRKKPRKKHPKRPPSMNYKQL